MPKSNHAISREVFIKASKKIQKREYIRWLNLYGTFRQTVQELDLVSQNKPVLIVMGEEDHLFLKPAINFCSLNNRAQLKVIEGAGHICNIEKPDYFNRLEADFLEGQTN